MSELITQIREPRLLPWRQRNAPYLNMIVHGPADNPQRIGFGPISSLASRTFAADEFVGVGPVRIPLRKPNQVRLEVSPDDQLRLFDTPAWSALLAYADGYGVDARTLAHTPNAAVWSTNELPVSFVAGTENYQASEAAFVAAGVRLVWAHILRSHPEQPQAFHSAA